MFGTMYTSYSGLMANSTALNVVGNNLSNVNTVGYKAGRADFAQIMSSTIGGSSGNGSPMQIGLGVHNTAISPTYRQGAFQSTGVSTQVALDGNGFFSVADANGNISYTRAGNFGFDESGVMISSNGSRVQGYFGTNADGTVDTSGGLGDLQFDFQEASPARATELLRFQANLPASAVEGETASNQMEVVDSAGVKHQLTVQFTKTANEGEWTYAFELPGGVITSSQTGAMQFDSQGRMTTFNGASIFDGGFESPILNITGQGEAEPLAITWDLGVTQPNEEGEGGGGSFTSFGDTANFGTYFQDGYGTGTLQKIDIGDDGTIYGFYDNGVSRGLARVAVATFTNNQGLKQANGGYFKPTAASGEAQFDVDNAGRGSMHSGFLETSNVDVAEELTSLIIHQRGFQSNSKTITTADQVLQEILSLKR